MSNLEKPDRHSLTAICWGALCRHASPRVLLALLALAVALTMAGHFFKRGSADWLVEHVPASWAQAASDRTLHRLDASVLKPSALPLDRQTAINTEFAALRVPQGEPPLYRLVFRHGGALGARGFTLAGGQIVVTDEWVQQFGNDRALLTALSTQLGHLQHRDALRSAIAHARLGMLLALFRGDAETATRLMSDAQPVLEYDERSEQAAARFSTVVMQANP
ncbi:MAG: Zn-dependent protease with chaperone function [Rhodocyclales bacterium]|nr:Zn-dependent protease with chaperone function [Rhodocyclales bacterium]